MLIPAATATDSNLILRPRDLNPYSALLVLMPKCLGFGTASSGVILPATYSYSPLPHRRWH
jgi:hypothetical protein